MNRQQFLAELSQYLTFFSPEEKAQIISAYNEKFNSAGSENEAMLIAELGTPMKTAIDLKRRVEAGEQISFAPENNINQTEAPPENNEETEAVSPASDEPSEQEAPAAVDDEAHTELSEEAPAELSSEEAPAETVEEAPIEAVEELPTEEASQEAPAEEIPQEAPEEAPVEEISREAPVALSPEEIPEAPYEYPIAPPAPREERDEPEKLRRKVSVPKLIGASLLSIVITVFFLAIAAVGVVVLVAMSYLLLAGLKNLVYVTDCLLLFGGGLVCAGLGLLIVWFAMWSAASLISGLFRNALGFGSDKEYAA